MPINTKSAIILIVLIVALVYVNSLKNSFVWDDYSLIVENDFVKSWKNFYRLFNKSYLTKISDIDYLGERDIGSGEFSYRPVVTFSYFVDFSIWRLEPFGYHLTNLILHILNAVLLFIFVDLIVRDKRIALLTSLFFAVHPVNAEAVNNISFREDLFVFLFFILAFIFYIKRFSIASLFMFLLALFSKEMAIIFPLVLLCYDYLFKKMPKDIFAHLKTYYLGYIGILLFYIFIRFILMANADKPMLALPMANLYTRTLTMPKVILTYIQWMLFPVNVHPTLPDDPSLFSHSLFEPGVLISISAIVALLVIAVRLRKKSPLFSFAVLWFFIALIPVSNIFYPLTNYIASRYLYLPVVGFCLLLAVFVSRLPDVRVISTILLIFYAIFTVIANMGWKNNVTFWSGMVENYPDNALAHSSLASSFRKSGLLDKAISEYKAALSLDPNYAKDYNNLGECFYQKGMFAEAMQELKKALELDPGLISAYINLGSVFGDKGSYPQAIKYFEKAIQLDRGSLNAYNGLGVTYARMKKYDLARKAWEKALEIGPDNKAVQENLRKLRELGI